MLAKQIWHPFLIEYNNNPMLIMRLYYIWPQTWKGVFNIYSITQHLQIFLWNVTIFSSISSVQHFVCTNWNTIFYKQVNFSPKRFMSQNTYRISGKYYICMVKCWVDNVIQLVNLQRRPYILYWCKLISIILLSHFITTATNERFRFFALTC